MAVFAAITTTDSQAAAQALADAVEELDPAPYGIGVFEVEDGSGAYEVGAHYTEPPDEIALALLAAALGARPFAVSEVPDRDWVAHVRRELPPVRAGRFFVYGSHDEGSVPEGVVALRIDAAMAFGTGHHGTTMGCLRALDRLAEEGFVPGSVADVGSGTAVLAMAAAAIWPGTDAIIAGDIDMVAVETAAANVTGNGLGGRVNCVEAAGFDHPAFAEAGPFDLIFANILKGPLVALAPAVAANATPGCKVILSGILVEQADGIAEVYSRNGFNLTAREDIVDWSTLILTREA